MSSVAEQVASLVVTFLFAFFFAAGYGVYNRLMYRYKKSWIRLVGEPLFFLTGTACYFWALMKVDNVRLHIYLLPTLLAGIYLYQKVVSPYWLGLVEQAISWLKIHFINPLRLYFNRVHAIIKRKLKRVLKHGKKKRSNNRYQTAQHWVIPDDLFRARADFSESGASDQLHPQRKRVKRIRKKTKRTANENR